MPYIKNWSDFEAAATQLYTQAPNEARYCVKFKRSTGHLVLRITDNKSCIMYKTFSAIILNRFETLNLRLLSQMANIPRATTAPTPAAQSTLLSPPSANTRAASPGVSGEEDDPMSGAGGADAVAGAAGAGAGTPAKGKTAGGKKKKKGKK